MKITELNGKNVCIMGYGLEGKAAVGALRQYAPDAKVTVADGNPAITIDGVELQVGPNYLAGLDRFDTIIRSGGIPNLPELEPVMDKVTNMTSIFFDSIKDTGVRSIGITGSKGKSTTTTLIYDALHAHDPDHTFMMGNLYLPMIEYLDKAKPGNTFVIELSSYMLEAMHTSPNIAVVTSFFPDHLDRHGTVENYWAAKKNIASHQTADDAVFYSAHYPECLELAQTSPGHRFAFTAEDFPLEMSKTKFIGDHNRSNMAAAFLVAKYVGVPEDVALTSICNTTPLPHRLQQIGVHAGIHWVNDSIATTPEATLAALDALGNKVQTIFLGGFDRGYDFTHLGARLAAEHNVKNIIFFPDTGARIKAAIPSLDGKNILETADMQQAVTWAATHTTKGKTALLSCASPSFNLYKDFNLRGEAFMDAVKAL